MMTRNGTYSLGECSSSTSMSSQRDVEDDRMIAQVLSEEYAKLDGAVGRRLSNLTPVPLKDNPSLYEGYVPMKYRSYCKKMAKSGEWGDHITLQAAADKFAAKICLLTSFRETCFIEIAPQCQEYKRELWLSFWSEVHYNSLYDSKDALVQQKRRKRHWLF